MPTPFKISNVTHCAPMKQYTQIMTLAALVALVSLGGCGPKSPEQTASASPTSQAVSAPEPSAPRRVAAAIEQPVTARPTPPMPSPQLEADAGGKVVTIAGGWVNAGGACDSGASVFFNPDGTYMSEGENGTWALSGKTLTVTTTSTIDEVASTTQGPDESTGDSGEKAVLTLLSVTDDAARVVLSNGSNANWTRCTS